MPQDVEHKVEMSEPAVKPPLVKRREPSNFSDFKLGSELSRRHESVGESRAGAQPKSHLQQQQQEGGCEDLGVGAGIEPVGTRHGYARTGAGRTVGKRGRKGRRRTRSAFLWGYCV
jgi:hypothetical protein